jgi:hypothetical protein
MRFHPEGLSGPLEGKAASLLESENFSLPLEPVSDYKQFDTLWQSDQV